MEVLAVRVGEPALDAVMGRGNGDNGPGSGLSSVEVQTSSLSWESKT